MSPAEKLSSFVASTTVFLMFWLVSVVAPKLVEAGINSHCLLGLASLLTSAGMYRGLALLIRWLMEKSAWIRRLVFGPYYMYGTWVGEFTGHDGDKRYMVEHFCQEIDSLTISGRSFTIHHTEHGYWRSESVTVDARNGRLIFTYIFENLSRSSSLYGVHTSSFERSSAKYAPTKISGFAQDMNDTMRIAVHSEKISESLLPWNEALKKIGAVGRIP